MGKAEKRACFQNGIFQKTHLFCVKFGYVIKGQISYLSTKRQRAIFLRSEDTPSQR